MEEFITYEDVEVFTSEIAESNEDIEQVAVPTPTPEVVVWNPNSNSDVLSNANFNDGVSAIVNAVNPDDVQNEVYRDSGSMYALSDVELPEYVVKYQVNGYDIYFPTEYSEDILVVDGMLVNLGANYTVGTQLDGYSVSNYLSSEITIPTYHSATWYQYQQNYGQPYRIVDRYVNNYGSIASSTRDSVRLEFSGSQGWHGFTFSNIALLLIVIILFLILIFRKGR